MSNHLVTVKFNNIAQHSRYYYSGTNDNTLILPALGNAFFSTPEKTQSRKSWKDSLIDNLHYGENQIFDHKTDHEHTRLFGNDVAKKIYDDLIPLFRSRYEYDGSVMKGQFNTDPTFVERVTVNNPNAKIHMIGDIHGSLHALYYTLNHITDLFVGDTWVLTHDSYLIFLGDVVDYSYFSLECLALVFMIYIANPSKVTILNGNHEDKSTYMNYQLETEMKNQFDRELPNQFEKEPPVPYQYSPVKPPPIPSQTNNWTRLLHYLPSAVYLDFVGKIYHLSHGAFDTIYCISRPGEPTLLKKFLDEKVHLGLVNENDGYISQYKWGDFHQSIRDTSGRIIHGMRSKFSKYAVKKYLDNHKIECIISGHQDNIPLGLLVNDEAEVDSTKFNIEKNIIPVVSGGYDLYVPITTGYDNRYSNVLMDDIKLTPNKDFIALVTSNSTQSKPLSKSCYLTLSNNVGVSANTTNTSSIVTTAPTPPISPTAPSVQSSTTPPLPLPLPNLMAGGNKNYEELYLKYKAKYLLLSNKIKKSNKN